jgi:hypothetical protein
VADSVYGGNSELRDWLEVQQQQYVMAVACDEPVVLHVPTVGVRRLEVRDVPAYLSASDWQPLSLSEGTKGPRLFDWACLPIWQEARRRWLAQLAAAPHLGPYPRTGILFGLCSPWHTLAGQGYGTGGPLAY